MIDSENLRTASLYINNQLLSRGLLRDGQSIDFADPGRCDGGVQATMGKVMSVVNDLILRRDRDAEHRESLSSTLRTLRVESQRQATEHQRTADRLADAQRRLDGAEATERALRAQLRAAEGSVHRLKEEAQRTRALVAQTRAACATEVRRRDRQIEGLKRAVVEAGRVRGSGGSGSSSGRRNGNVTTITISGEVGGEDEALPPGATADEAYDLRMETNEFLTRLAGSLNEENEGLRALVRRAVEGLREMSGLEGAAGKGGDGGGIADAAAPQQQRQQRSAEELAAELDAVLDHLRTILTNPSFVPIEEVEVRDEEIQRLRAGFERLETRWKDAVVLIDGWRRRMGSGGRSVDVEELSAGLRLSPVRVQDVRETADVMPTDLSCVLEEDEEEEEEEAYGQEQKEEVDGGHQQQGREQAPKKDEQRPRSPSPVESLHLVPAPGYEVREGDEDGSESSSIFEDDIDMDELEAEEPNVQVLQESTWRRSMEHSPPLPEPPELSPLKDSYSLGNRGSGLNSNAQPHPKGPGDFTTIIEEKTWELATATTTADEVPPVPPPHTVDYKRRSQEKSGNESKENKLKPSELVLSTDSRSDSRSTAYDSPLFGRSGEKPSMADPSKKLFSKPSCPANESPKKQEPEQKAKQDDHSKSAPGTPKTAGSGRRPQTRSSTKRVASNPNPPSPPSPEQQPSQPSPAPTTKSTASSKSASAQNRTQRSIPTSTAVTITATAQSQNQSSVRNNNATNPQTANSRLPRRNNLAAPPQQQTPLTMETIAAKLAAAEREADAARVRAKLRAARLGKRVTAARSGGGKQTNDGPGAKGPGSMATANSTTATTTSQAHQPEPREREQPQQRERERRQAAVNSDLEDVDPVKKDMNNNNNNSSHARPLPTPASPRRNNNTNNDPDADELAAASPEIGIKVQKRKRDRRMSAATAASRRASRRRSTLSPWELESLIQGGVGVESPAR
ncbi:hypothetical protein DL770_003188 [Monosporascus sp. CRB-9-2]|nr:hypothetical protein DL770_003188 [Monosporascus sp. CRB-9-2]